MTASQFPLEAFPSRQVDPKTLAKVLETLPEDERRFVNEEALAARRIPLPFQPGVDLIELTDPDWLPKTVRLAFLVTKDGLVRLEGKSQAIHEINRKFPLDLGSSNLALAYLSYFCFFIHGDGGGPFFILDDPKSPFLPELSADNDLSGIWMKPRFFGQVGTGAWRCMALVWYDNAIFSSDFIVQPDGMVSMLNDMPVRTDLPCKLTGPLKITGLSSPRPAFAPLAYDQVARIRHGAENCADIEWPFPPVVPGEWTELAPEDSVRLLEFASRELRIGTLEQPVAIAYGLCRARTRPLTCYGDALLVEALAVFPAGIVSFILHREEVVYLDGNSATIYALNQKIPLDLSRPETRLDYVRLFMNWLRAPAGRFQIVEDSQDGHVRAGDEQAAARLREAARPIEIEDTPDGMGGWVMKVVILHADGIASARLRLHSDGRLVMEDEKTLHTGLAIRPENLVGVHLSLGKLARE